MRALVVEDDRQLQQQIRSILDSAGFAVEAAADGEDGLFQASEYALDLAIVDLGLPGLSGVDLIRRLRAAGRDYPVLILTARDGWQDKVEGLEAGADDYLTKPFHPEELMARVRALLRRTGRWTQSRLQCGPVEIDTAAQRVYLRGDEVALTAYEYKVLEYLVLHAGEVIPKSRLTEHIYDEESDRDPNVIEVFVRRLRTKLDPDGTLQPIETLRGRGYRFALQRGGD
ncbi:MAG: response regulator transcription factor [Gammaproteobacteria bacterium]